MSASGVRSTLLIAAVFVAVSFPLATDPFGSVISHWDADIEHSLWLQWWSVRAVGSSGSDFFRTDMVSYPLVVDLHLADLNLAVNAASAALTGLLGLAGAYNALLLASFVLAAALAARLAERMGADPSAARLAGLAFAVSPGWQSSVLNGWGYLVHVWVLPLAFLALERARAEPTPRRFAALALALALAFHVTPYYFVYGVVLMALYLAPDAPRLVRGLRSAQALSKLAAFALPLVLLVLPRALPMVWAAAEPLSVHHGPQNTELAASLAELVLPSRGIVGERAGRIGYMVVFVGYVTTATILVGWSVGRRRRLYARWGVPGLVMLALALGPELKIVDGAPLGIPLPARWLQTLPVFELMTNHWRWALPATFCFTTLFGLALTDIRRSLAERSGSGWLVPCVALAFALEVVLVFPLPLSKPLWSVRPSAIAERLRGDSAIRSVVDRTRHPKLNQTVHGKPLALGWLPRLPASVRAANERLAADCRELDPDCLERYGIDAVILDDERALRITGSDAGAEAAPLRAIPRL
jgi:hypothetical protein